VRTVDAFRGYAEDPDSRWTSGPAPYESGAAESRPDDALGVPEQRPGDDSGYPTAEPYRAGEQFVSGAYPEPYGAAGGFAGGNPSTAPGGFGLGSSAASSPGPSGFGRGLPDEDPMKAPAVLSALDAIRVPLPATVYPPVRPGSAVPATDTPAAAVEARPPFGATTPTGSTPRNPPYNAATTFVPPMGVRTADGPREEPPAAGHSAGDGVYRTRRPVSAVVFAVATAVLMIPVLRLLIAGSFADRPTAAGTVPAVLLALGLPLTGFGLYALAGAGRPVDRGVWLTPPVGYLTVGLVLLVAAALGTA
jgi:hypothetical protein